MGALWQDVRYGLRMMAKSPGFTVVAVLSLALGIGANTAIFSMARTLLWAGVASEDPDRFLAILPVGQATTQEHEWSYPNYVDIRDHSQEAFEDLIVMSDSPVPVTFHDSQRSVRWWAGFVSSGYMGSLGVRPILGRTFLPGEDAKPDEAPVAVLGERIWQEEFNRDPQILGRQLQLNRTWVTVVGVVSAKDAVFRRLLQVDLFLPFTLEGGMLDHPEIYADRDAAFWTIAARLRKDVTRAQAQSRLDVLSGQFRQAYPQSWGNAAGEELRAVAAPAEELWGLPNFLPRHRIPAFAVAVFGLTGVIWLIACANVANLLLARAQARRRDIAVRLAIGGGRWPIVRQLLIEGLMLSVLGGAAGVLLAVWCQETVEAMSPSVQILSYVSPIRIEFGLDWRACRFALAMTALTTLAFGLLPAIQTSRVNVVQSLKEGGRSASEGTRGFAWRRMLIAGQIAMACLVLVGAGLFVRTVHHAMSDASGLDPRNLATVSFDLFQQRYTSDRTCQYVRRALERLETLPGVASASFAETRPLAPSVDNVYARFEASPVGEERAEQVRRLHVGPGFFETTRIPIVRGRGFEPGDWTERPAAVVINQALADRYWPGRDPIGRHVIIDEKTRWEIVGVAREGKYHNLAEPSPPMCFVLPDPGRMPPTVSFLVRTVGSPSPVLDRVRRELESLDPDMPVIEAATVEQVFADALLPLRFAGWLGTACAAVALILCAIGVYGLLAYYVVRRTHEIGVRLALGAKPRDIVHAVFRQVAGLMLAGMAAGLGAALAMSHVLRSLVFGVSPNDPLTFAVACIVLGAVALAACYLPAQRAAKIDPMTALRQE